MQEQGVSHDDPEYLKAHNLLSAVQRQQMFQKHKQFAQQQLQAQQRQQQQQLNGAGAGTENAANGVSGKLFPFAICQNAEKPGRNVLT